MMILVGNYFIKYWTFYSLESYGMQMLSISTKSSISQERHPLRNGYIRDWLKYLLFLICLCSPFHIYILWSKSLYYPHLSPSSWLQIPFCFPSPSPLPLCILLLFTPFKNSCLHLNYLSQDYMPISTLPMIVRHSLKLLNIFSYKCLKNVLLVFQSAMVSPQISSLH